MKTWYPSPSCGVPLGRGPPPQFQMGLRDINDAQLRQVMEDTQQQAARREGAASLMGSPLGQSWVPEGGVDTDLEDGKWSFKGRGWGPSKLLQWPAGPFKQHIDLLSTFIAGLRLGTPRINTFSGDATPGKIEVSFEQWCHKVQCVKAHYPESVVWESIIRSLKGSAADMAQFMGPTASVTHILWKL